MGGICHGDIHQNAQESEENSSAAPMTGTIQWISDFDVNPNIRTLVGMKMLAIRPISRRISGATAPPAFAQRDEI
jgi:hypothetical protein